MADSSEREVKEEQSKKHIKPRNEGLENTERDLQIIFKKLRVDNEPKRLQKNSVMNIKRRGRQISRSKEITSKRKIIKDATFNYKSIHQSKTKLNLDPDRPSLPINSLKRDHKSIDKNIHQTLENKDNKSPNQGQKCASDVKELSESCSEQFRRAQCSSMPRGNVNFDDTTPEELAAYFDQLLHIPKPMSAMAEMMYT